MSALRRQERSRKALRRAVAAYTALRGGTGHYGDTFPVTLRDGTPAVAILNLELVPDPTQEPTP